MHAIEERTIVAKVSKADCISIRDAQEALGISRNTMYNYLNILRIERRRFPFDALSYISNDDYERVKRFKETRELS